MNEKYARIWHNGKAQSVTVDDEMNALLPDGTKLAETEAQWLPPASGTMFALGLNYSDHASELDFEPPKEPLVFLKASNAFTGHRSFGWRPDDIKYMHYECELVAVIGKPAKQVKKADAWDYIQGFTLCNDYAVRDYLENYYRPNLRVKNRVGMTPIGPYIVPTECVANPQNLALKTFVNGELRQSGNTKDMIFDVPFLVEYLSSMMTLSPGDMIATGCPKGTSDVVAGDKVDIEIAGIGRLTHFMLTESEYFAREPYLQTR